MAPEQWRGEPPAAPADQYGWSVMAWELLLGERPFVGDSRDELREAVLAGRRRPPPRGRRVPQWLRRVVERGLAGEARQRFPDMAALVSALEHGQSRVRRRVTLGVLLAVGLAVGLGLGLRRWRVVQQIAACEAAGDELDAVWSDDGEQRLRGAFTATGLSYAESTTDVILPRLGEFSAAWRAARTELCMRVDVHGRWSDDLRARAMSCLADRRLRFAATVTELERATATTVRKAVATVAGLRSVEDCLAEDMLRRQPYPAPGGEELREVQLLVAQADSLALAGDARGGLAVATRARERAERFAWPPLLADAQATEGDLLRQTSALAEAEATTVAAYFTASDAGAWDVAAKAATQLIRIVGSLDRHAEGRLWARLAAAALVHAGDPQGLREAKRLFHLGYLQTRAGAFADAKQLYLRTLALREAALAPDHPDILVTLSSLADAEEKTGSPAAARALYERVLVIQERVLGPDHLEVAAQLTNLGSLLYAAGEFAEAAPLFARSLAITEKNHGPDDPATATALNNVAAVYHVAGDTAAARPLFARALALKERVYGPDHAEVATALDNLAEIDFVLGDRGAARAGYQRALEILERRLGREHPRVAITLSHLANWHMLAEEYAAARSLFQRALTVQEQAYGPDHPEVATYLTHLSGAELADGRTSAALPLLERAIVIFDAHDGAQLAELEARYYLATALVRSGGDHARALALARRTRDDLRSAGVGREALLAEVEQWLAQRESPARPPGRGE
jgi:tetratricopeptide (TPR) repeat protein